MAYHTVLFALLALCAGQEGQCAEGCPNGFIGNGVCDEACNIPECGMDGGDCGANPFTPCREPCNDVPFPETCEELEAQRDGCAQSCADEEWEAFLKMLFLSGGLDCTGPPPTTPPPTPGAECAAGCLDSHIGDGFCDPACNVPECENDGGDCAPRECAAGCPPLSVGNGMCEEACNVPECGMDGGDCDEGNPFQCLEPCNDVPFPETCEELEAERGGCAHECTDEDWATILDFFKESGFDCTGTTTTTTTTTKDDSCPGKLQKQCAKLAKNYRKKCKKSSTSKKCKKWKKAFAKKKCEKKCDFDPLGSKSALAFAAEGSLGSEPSASNNAFSVALVVLLCGLVLVALLLVALVARALRRTPEVAARPTRKLKNAEQGQYTAVFA